MEFLKVFLFLPLLAQYAFRISLTLVNHRAFRNRVLSALVHMYMSLPAPDYVNLCQCLIFLDDPKAVAEVLERLIGSASSEDDHLMAFQVRNILFFFLWCVRDSVTCIYELIINMVAFFSKLLWRLT